MELFSILTASYNNCLYLDDWCKSIISQNYRPLQVVFVNDCSTDDTLDKVNTYTSILKQHNIDLKIVNTIHRSYYASALKTAWQNASGLFFGVLDSDDMLEPNSVERIMKLYDKYPNIGYIYTQFSIYDNSMTKFKGLGFSCSPAARESLLDLAKRKKHGFSHWRTFSSRVPRVEKIFKDGLRSAVDKYMGYRLEELAQGIYLDLPFYKYRGWVPGCISATEKSKAMWKTIAEETIKRRVKYKYKPYPIITLKSIPQK